ncbi:PKD domain-containing protein [Pedobacter duraquae]|uniref:PKD repeat protein n=1 Tax=Pedobacter duraquae TaxID=425511 RepID=A0A4R6IK41_9SPHI|nr:PKD domain-containing protein [Pedobacter duraquae]TDO22397.1 PKD repeat protein [Pedobacter duraquae]
MVKHLLRIAVLVVLFCGFYRLSAAFGLENYNLFGKPWVFKADPNQIIINGSAALCPNAVVVLRANNAVAGQTIVWRKGGAIIAGQTGTTYTANSAGNYSVTVNGTLYPAVTLTMKNGPNATFTFTGDNQCVSQDVQFTNTSTGNGLTYSWDFGDVNSGVANTSTDENPTHRFVGATGTGTQIFQVKLTVTNDEGCSQVVTRGVTMNKRPNANLTGPNPTTFEDEEYFTMCTSSASSAPVNITNSSTTAATNIGYEINWGDGSPVLQTATFTSLSHTYAIGFYDLTFKVTGADGCVETKIYHVFVGSNPAVSIASPGNTVVCVGVPISFPISGTQSNPPGTRYTVVFNDGSAPQNYTQQTLPNAVEHTFNESSCGKPGNSFSAQIIASNPCGTSNVTVSAIYVSEKPVAELTSTAPNTCINSPVTFSSHSFKGNSVSSTGACNPGKAIWEIDTQDYIVVSGSLGELGSTYGNTIAGTEDIVIKFTTPGTHHVKIKVWTGNTTCGDDEADLPVCVNPAPLALFTTDIDNGCQPLTIHTTNTSPIPNCGVNSYQWSVTSATGTAGVTFDATAANPDFQFANPGTYTITLVTSSPGQGCTSAPYSKQIVVHALPVVTLSAATGGSICAGTTRTPSASVISTNAVTYQWTFEGGLPATSTVANPGTITYATPGTYTTTLVVTNGCGSTTKTSTVVVKPIPEVTVPAQDIVYCKGKTTAVIPFSSSLPAPAVTTYAWSNSNIAIGLPASGSGSIPAFTAANNGTTPISAIITVVPMSNGCAGLPKTFNIIINPQPSAPVASPTNFIYCLNENASAVSATATGANTLQWYTNAALTATLPGAPTPPTTTAGITRYYVTQTNSYGCESPATVITVTVNPAIANNRIGPDQNLCFSSTAAPITQQGTLTGGSGVYMYQWQVATGASPFTDIAGATTASYSPGVLMETTKYRRLVTSGSCASISNEVTLGVQPVLSNFNIADNQTICAATTPAQLIGEGPSGGSGTYTYTWERSTDQITWTAITGATAQNYQPGILNTTTYYRRNTITGICTGMSNIVMITVNPRPTVNTLADQLFCANILAPATTFSSPVAGAVIYAWTNDNVNIGLAASGTGNLPAFTTSNTTKHPIVAHISVTATYTANSVSCPGTAMTYTITILPNITINPLVGTPAPVCAGTVIPAVNPTHDADPFTGATITYRWTSSNPAVGLNSGTGVRVPAFATTNTTTTDITSTITVFPIYNYSGKQCEGEPQSYSIGVSPQPTPANAGVDQKTCGTTTTLNGNTPLVGSGVWEQTSGPLANIVSSTSAGTVVNGLTKNNRYTFKWTISNGCTPSSDFVTVDALSDIVNAIQTSNAVICPGVSVTLSTDQLSGGDVSGIVAASYTYVWEQSVDNQNWTIINGATAATYTVSPTASTWYRRTVRSYNLCERISLPVQVVVQPAITNNIVSGLNQTCTGHSPGQLTGTIPAGSDGNFMYQWQLSVDGTNWTTIAGANQDSYTVPVLTQNTFYRRIVSSASCNGAQRNNSNAFLITVNPDALAEFTVSSTMGCAPFHIRNVVTLVQHADRNSSYEWFVDGLSIGTGLTIPDYVIQNDGETAHVKLVATSRYGCESSVKEMDLSTVKSVTAAFIKDQVAACGPVTTHFTNTSTPIAGARYSWNFGNGSTSSLAQPADVVFQPHPLNRDTTYTITLTAITDCNVSTFTDTVLVHAIPKAIFTPDKTIGCSPFVINLTNQSRGTATTYTYSFGNGDKIVKSSKDGFSYTYNTTKTDTLTLKMVAENSCGKDSTEYQVVVYPNQVQANLVVNGNNQYGCSPVAVTFTNNTTGATTFNWDFGDGNTAVTTQAPATLQHIYTRPGVYTVKLLASNGCSSATTTQTITVYEQPASTFTLSKTQYCVTESLVLNNTSATPDYSYLWDFGDGTTSNAQTPVHAYTRAGVYTVKLTTIRPFANGASCSNTVSHSVQILAKPVMVLTSNAANLNCGPFDLVVSTPASSASAAEWNFGDPQGANNQLSGFTARHTYTRAGIYRVRLIAYNSAGCADSTYLSVRVTESPLASFTPGDSILCGSVTTINFRNTSTYGGTDLVTYKWLINNAVVSNQRNLSYNFTPPASGAYPLAYAVKLIVTSTLGCSDTSSHTIQFNALPKAAFTIAAASGCAPYVPVVNNTSQYADLYTWYVDNRRVSTEKNPVLSLPNPATTYRIKLVVNNIYGCKADSLERSITTYPKPVAAFSLAENLSCNGKLDLKITNSSTGATSYTWNFGDGTAEVTGATPAHTYGAVGTYQLRVIASNGFCRDTAIQEVRIAATPQAAFTANVRTGCTQITTTFTNISVNTQSYVWDFGDGTYSIEKNPVHTYSYLKSPYTVKLVATGDFGCSDTAIITNYIVVSAPPKANFEVLPDTLIKIPDFTFTFNNISTGNPVKYKWEFGDGRTADTRNAVHTYPDSGIFKVRLTVTNAENCVDVLTRTVQITNTTGYLYVPNAFEPGSLKPELQTFGVRATGLSEYTIKVFNTWGELVWSSSKLDKEGVPTETWDGTMRGSPAPQGVYVWYISAKFINGSEWKGMKYQTGSPTKTGPIHLIR